MRNKIVWLLAALLSLSAIILPSQAKASSVYDDVIAQGEAVATCSTADQDLSASYLSIINGASSSTNKTNFLGYLDDALEEEQGLALVQHVYTGGYKEVKLLVSTQPATDSPFFANYGGPYLLMMPHAVAATIYCNGGSNGSPSWGVDFNMGNTNREIAQNVENSWILPVFINMPFTYPSGYEGVEFSTEMPKAKYVAMGDSFSSGEGNESFEPGTDVGNPSENRCHRSFEAYPHLLKDELELGSMAFVACSGATTSNLIFGGSGGGSWGEGSQLNALSDDTEVVTLTIGGNDVGFSEFAKKCVSPLNWPAEDVCDEHTDVYEDITDAILNDLPSSLESVYGLILDLAPNAEIYVGGYPIVAPWMASNEPFDQDCGGLYDEAPTNTWGDARAAYDVVTLLNAIIETAVLDTMVAKSTTRLHFVDVESGAFSGHDICETDSYFNGIDPFNPEYSVHPNYGGQAAYAADFETEMN